MDSYIIKNQISYDGKEWKTVSTEKTLSEKMPAVEKILCNAIPANELRIYANENGINVHSFGLYFDLKKWYKENGSGRYIGTSYKKHNPKISLRTITVKTKITLEELKGFPAEDSIKYLRERLFPFSYCG